MDRLGKGLVAQWLACSVFSIQLSSVGIGADRALVDEACVEACLVLYLAILCLLEEGFGQELRLRNLESLLVVRQGIESTEFVGVVLLHGLEVQAMILGRQELLMHNFESITNSIIFTLQSSEASQDLVVDAFDEDNPFKWIVVLNELVVLIPGCHSILCLKCAAVGHGTQMHW